MLASIHPLGERARHNRWGHTATAYTVGSVAGGTALGAVGGSLGAGLGRLAGLVLGRGPSPEALAVGAALAVSVLAALAAGWDGGLVDLGLPSVHRQVNEEWLGRYRGWVYGVGFGFQLGVGVVTIVTTAAVYLTFVLALLSGSTLAGLAVGACFGLARAAPLLLVAGARRPDQLRHLHLRLAAAARLAAGTTVAVLVAVAVTAAVVAGAVAAGAVAVGGTG